MQIIDNEMIVAFDCDDTLVMWDSPNVEGTNKVTIDFADTKVHLTPHNYHIQLLKMHKERGYMVILWSANGKKHAERVAKALGIEKYVDYAMAKFIKHFDDSSGPIIGPRVYVEDLTKPISQTMIFQTVGGIPVGYGSDSISKPYKPFGGTSG